MEKEDGSRPVAVQPPVSGYAAPGHRAGAVPPVSDKVVGSGAASQGEASLRWRRTQRGARLLEKASGAVRGGEERTTVRGNVALFSLV